MAPATDPKPIFTFQRKIVSPRGNFPTTFHGPIAWVRVFFGLTLSMSGVLFAKRILGNITDVSNGKLNTDTYLQAELITWEIKSLAILLGSALAGAGTFNSIKQGFIVGLGVGSVFLGISLNSKLESIDQVILTFCGSIALGLIGGWFGGQLFPPCVGSAKPKHMGPEAA
jgi:hypothetical protein